MSERNAGTVVSVTEKSLTAALWGLDCDPPDAQRMARELMQRLAVSGPAPLEQQRDSWIETARWYALGADYWRGRAERAERWYPATWFRRLRRLVSR